MPNTLIIFIKNPILGKVKSRLAKDIGKEKALVVYQDLLIKTRQETEKLENVNKLLYYSDFIDERDMWPVDIFEKYLQIQEGDLGKRMQAAFNESIKGKTIIIGSDCYDLKAEHIQIAFSQLETKDIVIGPANDGGYYLLGMSNFYPQLFEGIDWSTSKVFIQTLEKIRTLNLTVGVLEELVDLDTFKDIKESSYYKHYKEFVNDRKN